MLLRNEEDSEEIAICLQRIIKNANIAKIIKQLIEFNSIIKDGIESLAEFLFNDPFYIEIINLIFLKGATTDLALNSLIYYCLNKNKIEKGDKKI